MKITYVLYAHSSVLKPGEAYLNKVTEFEKADALFQKYNLTGGYYRRRLLLGLANIGKAYYRWWRRYLKEVHGGYVSILSEWIFEQEPIVKYFRKKAIWEIKAGRYYNRLAQEVNQARFEQYGNFENMKHPFHLVTPSPWPLATSVSVLSLTIGAVMYMHSYVGGGLTLSLGLFSTALMMGLWWRDVVREATYEGRHTEAVQRGLRIGVVLFIVSEVMFFVSFFWAFFHSSLAPAIEIGSIWPPNGIETLNPWGVPLLNTYILLYSGVTITAAHHFILGGQWTNALNSLFQTVVLAVLFTSLQFFEYLEAPFDISDGIYGSTFFMATGFHGFHVIVGTIFIAICLFRTAHGHFTRTHHLGFEAAAWYWHFVDVVWLFLFVSIYYWGSN
jgi:cytochrome c oxidase subunit 3